MSRTLYDKLVDAHKVCDLPDGDMLIYVDLHIMNDLIRFFTLHAAVQAAGLSDANHGLSCQWDKNHYLI